MASQSNVPGVDASNELIVFYKFGEEEKIEKHINKHN
jgi:hypothetical protein